MCSETKNMKLHVRPWNFQTLPELGHRRQSWSSKPLTDMFVTFLWGQTRICRASIFGVLRSSILTKDCLTDWVACAFAIWSNIKQPLWTLTCANIPNGINSIDLCSNFNAQMLLFAPCSPASTFGRMGTDSSSSFGDFGRDLSLHPQVVACDLCQKTSVLVCERLWECVFLWLTSFHCFQMSIYHTKYVNIISIYWHDWNSRYRHPIQ